MGSITTIFCNEKLVKNIQEVNNQINFATNGGLMAANMKVDLPEGREVWYSPDAIINFFNIGEVECRFKVTYNSKKSTFTIHMPLE